MKLVNAKVGHLSSVASIMLIVLLMQGCTETRHMVVAATETTIGVNVSQNPATSSPQAKLGYNRAELAIVPSNRNMGVLSDNSKGNGAPDVPDVVMEIRYSGIFDWGSGSGIYQRLAVGKNAVEQPGASLMFAKDTKGNLTSEATNAVMQAISAKELSTKHLGAVDKISAYVTLNDKVDESKLRSFLDCAGFKDKSLENAVNKYKNMSSNDFKGHFVKDLGFAAPGYAEKCIK